MTIDSEAKKYIGRPEVFADLFNYFLYDGKQVIKPEDLKEMDSTQIAVPYGKSKKIEPKQRHRDILPDYRINLISPVTMDKLVIEKFKTDFRELSEFIKYKKDKDALAEIVRSNNRFRNMDILVANLINKLTNAKIELQSDEGGKTDMCEAIEGIREDARQEGLNKGREETARNLMKLGVVTLEQIAACTGLSLERVKSLAKN